MDRLTSMAVFVAAAEDGSLIAAARRFGLSASMAGKHVAAIEADLNVRLMQRSTRSLVLTEAGRAYYARCKRLLEDYDEARREASDARTAVRGVLRLAAPITFGEMCLGGVIGRYMARHPEVSIEVMLNDRYVDLLAEGVDVAIRIGQLRDSDLVARRLAPCKMIFCASPAFIEQHGEPRTIDDLRRAPRLAFSDAVSVGDWSIAEQDGTRHAIDGPVRMRANNMKMLLAAALSGTGITYGPGFVFDEPIADGKLVPLLPGFATTQLAIHAVYPTNRYATLKLRSFVDHLVSEFSK
ncbi:LysR family transcriptional regulator [Azospirillum sp. TSO35-2]|uniref:LysR family transcriptional regulator n=1 Tax=Azospirillum sp. TSO35-2 TaxID=716796 RepID=UPI000D60A8E6|nr:LysR family transcriptional regulator [Azospirillum sp. TSO35-2]PWC37634.1 LysR family transcriptional regulator [Azospirillum sp. TSO35-2]